LRWNPYLLSAVRNASANTIHLKNGNRVNAAAIWEENKLIKFHFNGRIAGFQEDDVPEIYHDLAYSLSARYDFECLRLFYGRDAFHSLPVEDPFLGEPDNGI